ncbi:methyltransferase [Streptomyces sp. NPDC059002]|uniref:methyltransferase n=1 Tax=Streptomyces sp. NPDC059002 TaxID=3346690 RepID=UPI00367E7788
MTTAHTSTEHPSQEHPSPDHPAAPDAAGAPFDPGAAAHLYRLAFGFVPAQMIHVAVRLRLPDLLAERTRTAEDLAAEAGVQAQALRRVLRGLASLGVVTETAEGFGLAPAGQLLRSDVPHSLRPMLLPYFDEGIWAAWGGLLDAVRTGRPSIETVTGGPVFAYFEQHPQLGAEFHAAMSVSAQAEAWAVAEAYDFSDVSTVVDVGGGDGTLLTGLLTRHPHLRGVLADTAQGVAGARDKLADAGVGERCEVVPGDFFASVPRGGDRYVIKSVLHDWDDDRCVDLLRNCRAAMGDTGRVMVVEIVAPPVVDAGTDPFLAVSDLTLMVLTPGRERTADEFDELFRRAGLELVGRSGPLGFSGYRIIEARSSR